MYVNKSASCTCLLQKTGVDGMAAKQPADSLVKLHSAGSQYIDALERCTTRRILATSTAGLAEAKADMQAQNHC